MSYVLTLIRNFTTRTADNPSSHMDVVLRNDKDVYTHHFIPKYRLNEFVKSVSNYVYASSSLRIRSGNHQTPESDKDLSPLVYDKPLLNFQRMYENLFSTEATSEFVDLELIKKDADGRLEYSWHYIPRTEIHSFMDSQKPCYLIDVNTPPMLTPVKISENMSFGIGRLEGMTVYKDKHPVEKSHPVYDWLENLFKDHNERGGPDPWTIIFEATFKGKRRLFYIVEHFNIGKGWICRQLNSEDKILVSTIDMSRPSISEQPHPHPPKSGFSSVVLNDSFKGQNGDKLFDKDFTIETIFKPKDNTHGN